MPWPQIPNQPPGMPDWYSPSGPNYAPGAPAYAPTVPARPAGSTAYGTDPSRLREIAARFPDLPQSLAGVLDRDGRAPEDIEATLEYMNIYLQMWKASSGIQKKQIEAQIADSKRKLDNEIQIAHLQAETSRYGVNQERQQRMADLREKARQFDLSHGTEMQKLGLQRAQTATEYLSTPDRFSQASDFLDLSSKIINGGGGVAQYGTTGPAQQKTMSDYAVLEGGGNPGRQVGVGQGAGADPRSKALKALIEASPPSDEPGLDNNGYAVLNAARAIYSMNLTPRQQAAIGSSPEYQAMLGSAGRRLGERPEEWWKSQQRTLPGQGASNRA